MTEILAPFRKMLEDAGQKGLLKNKDVAQAWLRKMAASSHISAQQLIQLDEDRYASSINRYSIGRMFLFQYDAKLKQELPYWDKFPLIFPIEVYDDGFLGINMHYLPPPLRASLMDSLYDVTNNKKYDDTTKLNISYRLLKSAAQFRYFKPTVHKYLTTHCRSKFVYISPMEWNMALFLPIARFQKANVSRVYADTARKLK